MSEHEDKKFEAYLAGDSPLSRHYRRAGGAEPPAALDARVLDHARRAIAAGDGQGAANPRRWIAPLSTAAVIVLAAALVLEITLQGIPSDAPPLVDPTATTEAVPQRSGERERADPTERDRSAGTREEARLQSAPMLASPPTPASGGPEPDADAVVSIAPSTSGSAAARKSADRAERLVSESEPDAEFARAPASMPAQAPAEPRDAIADQARAMAAPAVESVAGRAGDEPAAERPRLSLPGAGATGYALAPDREPDVPDDRLQAMYLARVLAMAGEGRDEEAAKLLDEVLERWPDIELPAGFPLADPRENPDR